MPKLLSASPWLSSAAINVLIGGIGLITGMLLARTLGPTGRGVLAESLLWPGFVLILGSIVNLQTGAYFWTKAKSSDDFSYHTVLGTNLLLSALLTVVLVFIGLGVNILALGLPQKQSFGAANVFLASIPLSLFGACFLSVFLAEERYDIFWGLRILQPTLYLSGLLILLLVISLSVFNIVLVMLIAMFIQLATAVGMYFRRHPFRFSFNRHLTISTVWYGTRTNMAGLPYHLNARLDQLLMSLLLSPDVLGYYVVAVGFSSLLSFIGNGVSMVMLPQSAGTDPTDQDRVLELVRKFRSLMLGLAAIGVAAAIASPFAIKILFGNEFVRAIIPAAILCVAGSVLNSNLVIHEMARGLGYPGMGAWAEGAGLIVTLVLLFALLPLWGAVGAAIASLSSYMVVFVVFIYLFSRQLGISIMAFVPQFSDIAEYQALYARVLQTLEAVSSRTRDIGV